jgi:EAL domain-containing protein (putative c-di-GMP-specific phosphodiesterase class I)
MSDGYLEHLKAIIQQTGVDPCCLELEITDGLFLSDRQAISRILDQIHQLGIKIAVDDLGTGFSP